MIYTVTVTDERNANFGPYVYVYKTKKQAEAWVANQKSHGYTAVITFG